MRIKITDIGHFLGGLATAFACLFAPVMGIVAFLLFIVYELDEDWRIRDGAWKDIRVFAVGYFVGMVLCLAARYLCHHLSMG